MTRSSAATDTLRRRGRLCARSGARVRTPKVEKVVKLHGCAKTMMLEPLRIKGCQFLQELCSLVSGQFNAIGEMLEVHRVTDALARAEHQVDRTAHESR